MPDRRKHRGPHPKDAELFSTNRVANLRSATSELSWLLTRGYAVDSALKLVGDRYGLVRRQRIAVRRAAAPDIAVAGRLRREVRLESVSILQIDGFNIIVTVEAALAGGLLLRCRDNALRDLASVHGSYRKVEETTAAVEAIGETLDAAAVRSVLWMLDRPVSNSGRLAGILRDHAADRGFDWTVELDYHVDKRLRQRSEPVATSDSDLLDKSAAWVNLTQNVIRHCGIEPWLVDLSI